MQQATADHLDQQLSWQLVYAHRNEDFGPDSLLGRASDFVMSSQASSAWGGEAKVRQKLIETGDVDIMVAIRSQLLLHPPRALRAAISEPQQAERARHCLALPRTDGTIS